MNLLTKSVLTALWAASLLAARPALSRETPRPGEPSTPQAQVQPSTLEEKITAVLPKPSEDQWLKIPWRHDFAQARAEANREGKPIFLWMMNGNPLGCT